MLTRSQPLKRTVMRRAQRKRVQTSFRDALTDRSGGLCEANLHGCLLVATDVCHRIARKAGGRPNGGDLRLSNVWHGCRACHQWATVNPRAAYDLGLALREGQDTQLEPFPYRDDRWVLLLDDGSFDSHPPVTPAGVL